MKTKIEQKIVGWAEDRNLIEGSDPFKQLQKLVEEALEVAKEFDSADNYKGNNQTEYNAHIHAATMEMGDVAVVLTIMCAQMGLDLEHVMEMAYNKIKDRKGRMIDGVFVKEDDL